MSQVRMMIMHRDHLQKLFGRPVSELETAEHWCKFCAVVYRRWHDN